MSHFPKPFFRPGRQRWYVQIGGKQILLGADREQAFEAYHRLMAEVGRGVPLVPPQPTSRLVVDLIDLFLEWVQRQRSPDTYEWYRYRLQRFAERYPKLSVDELRPFHVQEWVDSYKLSVTSRRNYLRTVKRCLHWATRQGHIEKSPIDTLEIPSGERKEVLISDEQFADLLHHAHGQFLKDLLIVSWETGCRPQESLRDRKSVV